MELAVAILASLDFKGFGPRTVEKIIATGMVAESQSVEDLFNRAKKKGAKVPEVSRHECLVAEDTAKDILAKCAKLGCSYIHKWLPDFPALFRNIPNAPIAIYAMGAPSALQKECVAIVGTRSPTEFGYKSGLRIAGRAVQENFVVVSGLAEGCDTAAHVGTLDAGGTTVAILAHGFGTIYPPSNKGLAEQILATGGCLVTEYPPGEPCHPTKFVARDRLQSGLSLGTIVIETDIEGGTMHTVKFTKDQGRVLGAVKHPPSLLAEPKTQGNQKLISEGLAIPIANSEDLAAFFKTVRRSSGQVSGSSPIRNELF